MEILLFLAALAFVLVLTVGVVFLKLLVAVLLIPFKLAGAFASGVLHLALVPVKLVLAVIAVLGLVAAVLSLPFLVIALIFAGAALALFC